MYDQDSDYGSYDTYSQQGSEEDEYQPKSKQRLSKNDLYNFQHPLLKEFMYSSWPQHACAYCGLQNKNCVVKCLNKSCGKWFCNQAETVLQKSHIIHHLVRCQHNTIASHPQSQFKGFSIQCFICKNMNIFTIGYLSAKNIKDKKQHTIFLCRNQCENINSNKSNENQQIQFKREQWKPLVEKQKRIVDWIAGKAGQFKLVINLRLKVANFQLDILQNEWKKNNSQVRYIDIAGYKSMQELKSTFMMYKTGRQYKQVFSNILKQQNETDKIAKQSQKKSDMTLIFNQINKQKFAHFVFGGDQLFDINFTIGTQLKITFQRQKQSNSIQQKKYSWSSNGIVVKIKGNQEIILKLLTRDPLPQFKYPYLIQYVFKPVSYKRMIKGLKTFMSDQTSISSYLYFTILGQPRTKNDLQFEIPSKINVPGLPKLNSSQQQALKTALKEPLCLIQGPPGTGKTVTSASIVYYLVTLTSKQVLVCAPTNIVVDMLAQKINKTGVNVIRMCSKVRQNITTQVDQLTLHYKIKNSEKFPKLKEYMIKQEKFQLNQEQEKQYKKLRKDVEEYFLKKADVICCTCIASADSRLQNFIFNHVLIDQATQATQPSGLLPMLKKAKHLILVGDHYQLGPVVLSQKAQKAGLDKCLYERLVKLGHKPTMLKIQYRMHPLISKFPAQKFYNKFLQDGITEKDRKLNSKFPWPENKPNMFLNVRGQQQVSASGTSFLNRDEVQVVDRILQMFYKSGIKANQIGIVTPYKGQRIYIINYFHKKGKIRSLNQNYYKQIEIASVDGFQGRQKDYIIVSCVRANDSCFIGFLKDPRRLNVTITRAKYGMIMVGDASVLSRDILWNNLLHFYDSINTLVQGGIFNFKTSTIVLPKKQRFQFEKVAGFGYQVQIEEKKEVQITTKFKQQEKEQNLEYQQDQLSKLQKRQRQNQTYQRRQVTRRYERNPRQLNFSPPSNDTRKKIQYIESKNGIIKNEYMLVDVKKDKKIQNDKKNLNRTMYQKRSRR